VTFLKEGEVWMWAFKKLGANEGLVMMAEPPQALDRYFSGEEAPWRKVIQDAGIKIE